MGKRIALLIPMIIVLSLVLISCDSNNQVLNQYEMDANQREVVDKFMADNSLENRVESLEDNIYVVVGEGENTYGVLLIDRDSKDPVDSENFIFAKNNKELQTFYHTRDDISFAIVLLNDSKLKESTNSISIALEYGQPHQIDMFNCSEIIVFSKDLKENNHELFINRVKLLDKSDLVIYNTDETALVFNRQDINLSSLNKTKLPEIKNIETDSLEFKNKQKVFLSDGHNYRWQRGGDGLFIQKGDSIYQLVDNFPTMPELSPDKTKMAFIDCLEFEVIGNLHIYDSESGFLSKITNYHYGRKASDTPLAGKKTVKEVKWLDDDRLLMIAGLSVGTVTQGGDVYLYDIQQDTLEMVIEAEDKTDIASIQVNDNDIKLTIVRWIDDNYEESVVEYKTVNKTEL